MPQETPPRDPAPDGADSENALAGRLGDYVQTARRALSDNTERAVRADLGIYAAGAGNTVSRRCRPAPRRAPHSSTPWPARAPRRRCAATSRALPQRTGRSAARRR